MLGSNQRPPACRARRRRGCRAPETARLRAFCRSARAAGRADSGGLTPFWGDLGTQTPFVPNGSANSAGPRDPVQPDPCPALRAQSPVVAASDGGIRLRSSSSTLFSSRSPAACCNTISRACSTLPRSCVSTCKSTGVHRSPGRAIGPVRWRLLKTPSTMDHSQALTAAAKACRCSLHVSSGACQSKRSGQRPPRSITSMTASNT